MLDGNGFAIAEPTTFAQGYKSEPDELFSINPRNEKTDLVCTKSVFSEFGSGARLDPTTFARGYKSEPDELFSINPRNEKTDLVFTKSVFSEFGSGGWI